MKLTEAGYFQQLEILHEENRLLKIENGQLNEELRNLKTGYAALQEIVNDRQREVLSMTDQRFRYLVTASSEVLYRMSPDWGEMLQLNSQGFLANTERANPNWLQEYIHPDDQPVVTATFRKAIKSRSIFELEHRVRQADGSWGWAFSRAIPILDAKGEIIEWFGAANDITRRKQAEDRLRESEEAIRRNEAILEQAGTMANLGAWEIEFVHPYDNLENPLHWSDQVYRIFGYVPGSVSVTRELFIEHVHPDDREKVRDAVTKALNEKKAYSVEHRIRRADGIERIAIEHADISFDEAGRPVRIIGAIQDITELKLAERGLQQRNEELTRFIYTVSHDLKSPLVTIKMFSLYLRDDLKAMDKRAQERDLGYIENAADKMGNLLDELLELSRIGRKEEPASEVLLETLVQTVIDLLAGRIREKKVKVHFTNPPVMLYGHKQRFIQLYQNLLDNAIKFMGDQPEPFVEIGAFTDRERNNDVVLFIRDNGCGIDTEHQHRIFGLFEKIDPDSEGTGIGLALVKRIVEVHEGKIWFTSGKGRGTTFYFTLRGTIFL